MVFLAFAVPDPTEATSILPNQRTTNTRTDRFLWIPSEPHDWWTVICGSYDSSIGLCILRCCASYSPPFCYPLARRRFSGVRVRSPVFSLFTHECGARNNMYFLADVMIVIETSKPHIVDEGDEGRRRGTSVQRGSDKYLQGAPIVHVLAFVELAEIWVEGHEGILRSKVQRVVETPVHLRQNRIS